MSEEMKKNQASVDAGNTPSINDKLNSTGSADNAGEGAKAKRNDKKMSEAEREELARQEELERRRKEDEARNEAYLKKKQAEMELAENYRKKLREEQEKRRAMNAQKKANRLKEEAKAEAERKKREEEELARQTAAREHQEDAERRNAEKDSYLQKVSDKQKENKKFVEDYNNAKEEAEREYAKRLEELAAMSAPKPKQPEVKPEPKPEANAPTDDGNVITVSFDDAPSENAKAPEENDGIITITFDDDDEKQPAADKNVAGDNDNIITVDVSDLEAILNPEPTPAEKAPKKAQAPSTDKAPKPKKEAPAKQTSPKSAPKAAPKKPETPKAAPAPKAEPKKAAPTPKAAPVKETPKAEAPKASAGDVAPTEAKDTAPKAAPVFPMRPPKKKKKKKKPAPMSPMQAYLLGNSTYNLANKETDFGKDHSDKKRKNELQLKNFPIPPIKRDVDGKDYKYASAVAHETLPSGSKKAKKSTKGGEKDEDSNLYPSLGAVSAVGAAGVITAAAAAFAVAATEKDTDAAQTNDSAAMALAAAAAVNGLGKNNVTSADTNNQQNASDGSNVSGENGQNANTATATSLNSANNDDPNAVSSDPLAQNAANESENAKASDETSDAVSDQSDLQNKPENDEAEKALSEQADMEKVLSEQSAAEKALAESDEENADSDKDDLDNVLEEQSDAENALSEDNVTDGEYDPDKNDYVSSVERRMRQLENEDKNSSENADGSDSEDSNATDTEADGKTYEKYDDANAHEDEDGRSELDDPYSSDAKKSKSSFVASDENESVKSKLVDSDEDDKEEVIADAYDSLEEYVPGTASKSSESSENSYKQKPSKKNDIEHNLAVASLALDDKAFDRYVKDLNTYEDLLLEEEASLRRKQQTYHGDESIIRLKACMDVERELVETYTDVLQRAIISNNKKHYKTYSKKLSDAINEYNTDISYWNTITGEAASPISSAYLNCANAGKPTPQIESVKIPADIAKANARTIDNIDKENRKAMSTVLPGTEGISARNPLVLSTRYPILFLAEERSAINSASSELLNKEQTSKEDIKNTFKLFERSERFTDEVMETERMLREKIGHSYGSGRLVYLKECMALEKQLIECYSQNYKCASKIESGKYESKYIKSLQRTIDEYNADLLLWSRLTETKPETISKSYVDNLKKDYTKSLLIPVVALPSDVENAVRRRNALRKKEVFVPVTRSDDDNIYEIILAKSLFDTIRNNEHLTGKAVSVVKEDKKAVDYADQNALLQRINDEYNTAIAKLTAKSDVSSTITTGKSGDSYNTASPVKNTDFLETDSAPSAPIGDYVTLDNLREVSALRGLSSSSNLTGFASPNTQDTVKNSQDIDEGIVAALYILMQMNGGAGVGLPSNFVSEQARNRVQREQQEANNGKKVDERFERASKSRSNKDTVREYEKELEKQGAKDESRELFEKETEKARDQSRILAYNDATERIMRKEAYKATMRNEVAKLREESRVAMYEAAMKKSAEKAALLKTAAEIKVDTDVAAFALHEEIAATNADMMANLTDESEKQYTDFKEKSDAQSKMLKAAADMRAATGIASYTSAAEKASAQADMLDTAADLKAAKIESDYAAYADDTYAKAKMLEEAAAMKTAAGITAYASAAEKTSAQADMLDTAANLKAAKVESDYATATEKASAQADMLDTATELKAAKIESDYAAYADDTYAKAKMLEEAAAMKTAAGITAYASAAEKASAQADMLDTAADLKAAKIESDYAAYAEKASAKADMLDTAADLKAAKIESDYASAAEKASAQADMLDTAADLKAAKVKSDYASAAEKASAQADMLDTAADLNAAKVESDYATAAEKASAQADMLYTAKQLKSDATISSYDKSSDDAYAKAKMLEEAAAIKTAAGIAAYASAADKTSAQADMLDTAADLKAAKVESDYATATEKASAQADMLDTAAELKVAKVESAYATAADKTSAKADMLDTAKQLKSDATISSYDKSSDDAYAKAKMIEEARNEERAKQLSTYQKSAEKDEQRTKMLKEASTLKRESNISAYSDKNAKELKQDQLLALAKKLESDTNNTYYDLHKAYTDANADIKSTGKSELKAEAAERAINDYAKKEEKARSKASLKSEAKYISSTDNHIAYAKAIEKESENDKLLKIAKELEAKSKATSYTEAVQKSNDKATLFSEAKKIASADDLTNFEAYSEMQKAKSAIKADADSVVMSDTEKRYSVHIEKATEEDKLLKKAKELQQNDIVSEYDNLVSSAEEKKHFKNAVSAETTTLELSAYDIAVAKEKRDQQYKIAASSYAYSSDSIDNANKKLQNKERRADLVAASKLERDLRLNNIYSQSTEKRLETKLDKDLKRSVIKEYNDTQAMDKFNRDIIKHFPVEPKNYNDLVQMSVAMRKDAELDAERKDILNLSRKDFKRYIKSERRDEKSIIKDIRRTRQKYKTSTKAVGKQHLRESVNFSAELLERYVETYKAALAIRHKSYMKAYERKATHALEEYIADLDLWSQVTKESVPAVSRDLIKDIKDGKEVKPIPRIDNEFKHGKKESRKMLEKDLKKFLRENEKLEIRALELEEAGREVNLRDGDETVIAKYHMKTDLDTVKSRIEYRKQRYIQEFKRFRYSYGEETLQSEHKHIAQSKKLKKMKKQTKKFIRYTKKNNERYYKLANLPMSEIHVKSAVKRDRVDVLLKRIKNLLMERDEVNMRLLTLYADENANPEQKNKTQRKRIDKVKLRATRRAFRQQRFLYKEARRFRVPQAQKDRIYEVMNRKTELKAYLAECKYRKRHEHGNAKARRTIRKEIRDTKRKLKYCERDFDIFMTKASKRSKRTPDKKVQFFWGIILVAMIAACTFGYVYAMSHKDEIMKIGGDYITKLGEFISKLTKKK